MATTLQKWGNSLAVRLPRPLLDQLGLREGAPVEVRVEGGKLVIASAGRRPTLQDLLAGMSPDNRPEEMEWGPPVGTEVW